MTPDRLLMCTRRVGSDYEAEPVVVETLEDGVLLRLDDGDELIFNRDELVEALAVDPVSRFLGGLGQRRRA